MTVQFLTPDGLSPQVPYHHVAVGRGSRQVHVAGQVGGVAAGAGLAEQMAEALRNVGHGLRGAGAGFADVVRLTVYITAWTPDQMGDLLAGVDQVRGELGIPDPMPPASLIGVEVLFEPGIRVEIEATAVLD